MDATKPDMIPVAALPGNDVQRFDWDSVAITCRASPGTDFLVKKGIRSSLYESVRGQGVTVLRRDRGFSYMTRNNKRTEDPVTKKEIRTLDLYIRYDPENDTTL